MGDLFGGDFPVLRLLADIQSAHVQEHGVVDAIEHAHKHIYAELFLKFDDFQLQMLVIPGARRPESIRDSMLAIRCKLAPDEMLELSSVSGDS